MCSPQSAASSCFCARESANILASKPFVINNEVKQQRELFGATFEGDVSVEPDKDGFGMKVRLLPARGHMFTR